MLQLFYIVEVICFFLVLYFMYERGAFRHLGFFYINTAVYVVFTLMSSLLISFGFFKGAYYFSPIENKDNVVWLGAILHLWSSLGLLLTVCLLDCFVTRSKVIGTSIFSEGCRVSNSFVFSVVLFWALFSLVYAYQSHPSVVYLAFEGASKDELALRRLELTMDYSGVGLIKTASINLSLILSFLIGASAKQRSALVNCLALLVFLLFLSLTGEKYYIVIGLLFYLFGRYAFEQKTIPVWRLLSVFLLACIVYLYQFGFELQVFSNFLSRVFLAQAISVYLSVDQYFQGADLFYFNSHRSGFFQALFGVEEPVRLVSDTYVDMYYPGMRALGTWNVNGIYIHEVIAGFGIFWAIAVPILLGVLTYLSLLFFYVFKGNLIIRVLYVVYTMSFAGFLTSFNKIVFNPELLFVFFLVLFIYFVYLLFLRASRG